MARVRAVVHGRVQGVGYRMSAMREATRLAVSGWVRNQDDGSVLIEAQGERATLERLVAWCRRGPAGAHVSAVTTDWLSETAGEERFEIRH